MAYPRVERFEVNKVVLLTLNREPGTDRFRLNVPMKRAIVIGFVPGIRNAILPVSLLSEEE